MGSVAVSILAHLGYEIVAETGKMEEKEMLLHLGAKEIIHRDEINDQSGKPMFKGIYAGVIDAVGRNTLATTLKVVQYGGSVTTCGNVAGHEFKTSVYPFILRGIHLLGVDSVQCLMILRKQICSMLGDEWKNLNLLPYTTECTLEEVNDKFDLILRGKLKERTIVKAL